MSSVGKLGREMATRRERIRAQKRMMMPGRKRARAGMTMVGEQGPWTSWLEWGHDLYRLTHCQWCNWVVVTVGMGQPRLGVPPPYVIALPSFSFPNLLQTMHEHRGKLRHTTAEGGANIIGQREKLKGYREQINFAAIGENKFEISRSLLQLPSELRRS